MVTMPPEVVRTRASSTVLVNASRRVSREPPRPMAATGVVGWPVGWFWSAAAVFKTWDLDGKIGYVVLEGKGERGKKLRGRGGEGGIQNKSWNVQSHRIYSGEEATVVVTTPWVLPVPEWVRL